jgi:YHS domain-containing protein
VPGGLSPLSFSGGRRAGREAETFADGRAELVFHASDGKYVAQARLRPSAKAGEFELLVISPESKTEAHYTGTLNADGKLIVRTEKPAAGSPAQITIHIVANGDRMVMLYEQQSGDRFTRLAEVGATREGAVFAQGSGKPECIVTGGTGTIAVQHNGQTYYVCCTGCRDYFNEDPAKILAEYAARKEAEKKK